MGAIGTIKQNSGARLDFPGGARAGFVRRIPVLGGTFCRRLALALEKRRSRRALMELTDAQLKDIGVSRGEAIREASRPFWD